MAQEIERKFLVRKLPGELDRYPHNEITQGYTIITDNDIEVRIRKKGGRFFQTVKSGSGLVRKEDEREISKEEFVKSWPETEGKRIEKVRYEIKYDEATIELDIYSGELNGLVVAEVEFENEEDSKLFTPPRWFGKEVTHDERYKNKNLALNGKP